MMRRILLALLGCVGCTFSLLVASEAKIGDTEYDTLAAAISAVTSGGTVELLQDVTLDATLTLDKGVTLSGGGKTITATGLAPAITVATGEAVVLKDLGLVGADRAIALSHGAEQVTLEGCNISASARGIACMADKHSGMTLTVKGSVLRQAGVSAEEKEKKVDYSSSRGITLYNVTDSTVSVEGESELYGFTYGIVVTGDKSESGVADTQGLKVNIHNATVRGWATLNVWGSEGTYSVENATLLGINTNNSNMYAAVVFNDDVADLFAGSHAQNNTLTLKDSTVTNYQGGAEYEHLIRIDCGLTALTLAGTVNLIDTTGKIESALQLRHMTPERYKVFKASGVTSADGATVNCKRVINAVESELPLWPSINAKYYWENSSGGYTARLCDFFDAVHSDMYDLCDGEFIDLIENVPLANDFTMALYEGAGTFTLNLGEYGFEGGGHLLLPAGIVAKTDKACSDLFRAKDAQYRVVETAPGAEGEPYTYKALPLVVSVTSAGATTQYTSLADALAAAQNGDTITLLANISETGLTLVDKQVTLVLDGHTLPAGAIALSGSATLSLPADEARVPVSPSGGYLLTYSEADEVRTYCTGKLFLASPELFAQGHALTIEGQDGTDTDTNLRLTYTEAGRTYVTLYTSTTAARIFAGWKYTEADTTAHAYTLTMKSGKVDSLRGTNKEKRGTSVASATILMEGGTAGIIASGWYFCPSVGTFTVKISGGTVGTVYGNGETASTASTTPGSAFVPTVQEARIEITGGSVDYVYGSGRALTQTDTSAAYSMRTQKATIDISGGTVLCVNGGGFNGPEDNWGETKGQDRVIVDEAEITVRGGTVGNVFGGGYNGQWKWTYKYHESDGLVFSNYNGEKTTTVRNLVYKSTVNVQEGATVSNLYLGGRSYAYVEDVVATISGGRVGTLSLSGNYGYVAKSTATVSGGQVDKAELLTRNYAGDVSLTVSGGTVGALYAGVGGAYKNKNCIETEPYNVCTQAILGSATISAAAGTVSAAYLTTGLEKATSVSCNLPLTVKTMDLVEDSGYTGTLTSSGHFAIEAAEADWQGQIAFATRAESFKPLADTTGSLVYTSLLEGAAVVMAEDLTRSLGDAVATVRSSLDTTAYATLPEAVEAAQSGDTVTLLQDLALGSRLSLPKALTLNLGGYVLTGAITVSAPGVTLTNGTLSAGTETMPLYLAPASAAADGAYSFTLAADATISGGVWAIYHAAGTALDIAGKVQTSEADSAAISGNGTQHGTRIVIRSTAELSAGDTAIYHPQSGELRIEGGTITGSKTGIEIRAGQLTVDGGAITSTASSYSVEPNGSGTTTVGAGIAVAQHTTKLPLEVSISGGEVSGYTALSEANPQNNPAEAIAQVRLSITGGTFKAINGGTTALSAADCTHFVSGGYFSSEVPYTFCAAGYIPTTLADAEVPHTVTTAFVAVKAEPEGESATAKTYSSLNDIPAATEVYLGSKVDLSAGQAKATTGTLEAPQDATTKNDLTVKEVAEVFGGAFTVEKVSEGEKVVTKLVYHYNFGVSGITMDEAGQVSVVAKLMEAKGSDAARNMVAVNRTLVGRTLTVTLNGDDEAARQVFTVTNPVFDSAGTCTVPIAADALRRGTNTFEVSVAAP